MDAIQTLRRTFSRCLRPFLRDPFALERMVLDDLTLLILRCTSAPQT